MDYEKSLYKSKFDSNTTKMNIISLLMLYAYLNK
jgi:hypothetical protein